MTAPRYGLLNAPAGEQFREGRQLTGSEVPNAILKKLDAVWPNAGRWSKHKTFPVELIANAVGIDVMLDQVEEDLLAAASHDAATRGHGLLLVTETRWYCSVPVSPLSDPEWWGERQVTRDEMRRPDVAGRMGRGVLIARRSGLSIPLLTEETS